MCEWKADIDAVCKHLARLLGQIPVHLKSRTQAPSKAHPQPASKTLLQARPLNIKPLRGL